MKIISRIFDTFIFWVAVGLGMFAGGADAQIVNPQIPLTGNIGCSGFPCVNTGTLVMASDANRTLTAQETSAFSIKVTSSVSLTGTRNVIFPAGRFPVDVENATTGGQSIQVIGASGTGVTIPNGQTVRVWNDGTNFVQVGASGSGSVSTVSVTTANGVSGTVANPTTTPAISLTLGAITPTSVTATGPVSGASLISGTPSAGALAACTPVSGSHCAVMDESSTAGVPAAGVDYSRSDSATHRILDSYNNGAEAPRALVPVAGTSGHLAVFKSNGIDLQDGGSPGGGSIPGGVANNVPVQTAPGVTGFVANNSTGTQAVLVQDAGGTNTRYVNNPTLNGANFTNLNAAFVRPNIVTSGLVAQYQVTDVTGTTLPDSSGNGNNATLCSGSQQPSLISGGIYFDSSQNQCVKWPTSFAYPGVKTIIIYYRTIPPPVGPQGGSFSGFFCDTGGGLQLIGWNGAGFPVLIPYGNGSPGTVPLPGVHMLGYEVGAPDAVFVDGLDVESLGNTASAFTAGNYQTGYGCSANPGGSQWEATMYYALFYSRALTQQEMLQNYNAITPIVAARGAQTSLNLAGDTSNHLVCSGDSLSAGVGTGVPYCNGIPAVLNDTYEVTIYALAGFAAETMRAYPQARENLIFSSNANKNVGILWEGTNDMVAGTSASATFAFIGQHSNTERKRGGATVLALDMISRTGADTQKNALNVFFRANGTNAFFDGVVDVAALPQLGADGAYANTTYFQVDGVHLTAAGYLLVTNLTGHTVNMLYGSSIRNCDATVITASTYTGLDVDGCKQFDTTSNNIAYTLFPATGYTNRLIYACNVSTSGTNVLTVTAASGEYINDPGTTSITIKAGTCRQLRSTLVSPAAGGDYWRTADDFAVGGGHGTTPTLTAGTGAGTSPTLAISGNDAQGVIAITIGTSPAAGTHAIVTATFSSAYSSNAYCVISPATLNSSDLDQFHAVFVTGLSASSFQISAGVTELTAGTAYQWNYHCGN